MEFTHHLMCQRCQLIALVAINLENYQIAIEPYPFQKVYVTNANIFRKMADANLLDEIKLGFGLKNDSELAGFLEVTRATIHNARFQGDRRLGRKARFLVIDRIAFLRSQNTVGQWIAAITTRRLAERLIEASNGLARQRASRHLPKDGQEIAEKDLIEVAKEAFECETDDDLAAILGVARNTVSAVRSGRTSLGMDPRLAILNRIEKFPLDKLKLILDSTDDLIEEIRAWKVRKNSSQGSLGCSGTENRVVVQHSFCSFPKQ